MKKRNYCVLILFFLVILKISAQSEDKPLWLNNSFKSKVNIYKIKSYAMPYLNNDSLLEVNKKNPLNNENTRAIGTILHVDIDLKKNATVIKTDSCNVWLLRVLSPNAKTIGFTFSKFIVPKGAKLFCIDLKRMTFDGPLDNRYNTVDGKGTYSKALRNNSILIEYSEPKNVEFPGEIMINGISHGFIDPVPALGAEKSKLKSSFYGTVTLPCHVNISCPIGIPFSYEARSVALLYGHIYSGNTYYQVYGSGCFINKIGNYAATDHPYFLTAWHIFETLVNNGIDMNKFYSRGMEAILNVQTATCDDDNGMKASTYPLADFSLISSGRGHATNDDWALFQINNTVDKLRQYNVCFAGWSSVEDLTSEPFTSIHHPASDIKKITQSVVNQTAIVNNGLATFHWNVGTFEPGSSGGPIFDSHHKLVAVEITSSGGCDIGRVAGGVTMAHIYDYADNYTYIGGVGSLSCETVDANNQYVPTRCMDCTKNFDEEGIDCGGSCLPCSEVPYNVAFTNGTDNLPSSTDARNEILVDGGTENISVEPEQIVNFNAGNSIKFKNKFRVKQNSSFKATTSLNTANLLPRQCRAYCLPGSLYNIFCRQNGFVQDIPFVTWYHVTMYQYHGGNWVPTYTNSDYAYSTRIKLWDFKQDYHPDWAVIQYDMELFYFDLYVRDCMGNETDYLHRFFYVQNCLKSAKMPEPQYNPELNKELTSLEETGPVNIFPNPTNDLVTIEFHKASEVMQKIEFFNINGDLVKSLYNVNSSKKTIDLSNMPSGILFVKISSNSSVSTKKIIVNTK